MRLTTAVALWAARTRFFGVLDFLPKSHFEVADIATRLDNLRWGYRALGEMFNIVPGASLAAALPRLVNVVVLGALMGAAVVSTLRGLRTWPSDHEAVRFGHLSGGSRSVGVAA